MYGNNIGLLSGLNNDNDKPQHLMYGNFLQKGFNYVKICDKPQHLMYGNYIYTAIKENDFEINLNI